jgi:hypothetical protein
MVQGLISPSSSPPYSGVYVEGHPERGGPSGPGTYTVDAFMTGSTCDLCIGVATDCTSSGCSRYFIADQATVEITVLTMSSSGSVTFSLRDAHFVELNSSGTAPLTGGETYCLDNWNESEYFLSCP